MSYGFSILFFRIQIKNADMSREEKKMPFLFALLCLEFPSYFYYDATGPEVEESKTNKQKTADL
jgi:hypothetical protein